MSDEDLTVAEVRELVEGFRTGADDFAEARALRERSAEPFDAARWRQLVEDMGIAALSVSEDAGGLGVSDRHLVGVQEALGAGLYAGPVLGSLLAGRLITAQTDAEAAERAMGGAVIAVATPGQQVTVVNGRISGSFVAEYGTQADLMVAITGTEAALVDLTGAERETLDHLDFTRPVARLALTQAPVVARASGDQAARLRTLEYLLRASEQVGVAYAALAEFVEYATTRRQFDQIIGTFQGLQHSAARIATECVRAQALVRVTLTLDETDVEGSEAAGLLAAAAAGRAVHRASHWMVHGFGGIGFTWEHDAHLFYRRAMQGVQTVGGVATLERAAVKAGALQLLRQEVLE